MGRDIVGGASARVQKFYRKTEDILLLFDFLRPGSALDQPNFECILCA